MYAGGEFGYGVGRRLRVSLVGFEKRRRVLGVGVLAKRGSYSELILRLFFICMCVLLRQVNFR